MKALLTKLVVLFRRPHDFTIGPKDRPYMLRWYIIPRNRFFNVYLHKICRDDDDRALHDHPWASLSLILAGGYCEVKPSGRRDYAAGSVILRGSTYQHRLEVLGGEPCWTLFVTGSRVREWGFHCPKGFVSWKDFCATDDYGNIGRGCGEMS